MQIWVLSAVKVSPRQVREDGNYGDRKSVVIDKNLKVSSGLRCLRDVNTHDSGYCHHVFVSSTAQIDQHILVRS
jgi:hypothetical protein